MMAYLKKVEEYACSWPGVSAQTHRFGGRVFRLGRSEVGHIHNDGAVEIPFPRAFRDELVAQSLAEKHRVVPDSGWITFHVRGEADIEHAIWLLRLSYLRYVLKAVPDPGKRFDEECRRLKLNSRLRDHLERFVPGRRNVVAA